MKRLTALRSEQQHWQDLSVQVSHGVLVRLDRAFQAFFRRVKRGEEEPGFPRFRGRGRYQCIEPAEVTPSMVKGNRIKIKGLPIIRIRPSRTRLDSSRLKALRPVMHGRILSVDFVYAEQTHPLPRNADTVGIDMGVNERMTLSDGDTVERRASDRKRGGNVGCNAPSAANAKVAIADAKLLQPSSASNGATRFAIATPVIKSQPP